MKLQCPNCKETRDSVPITQICGKCGNVMTAATPPKKSKQNRSGVTVPQENREVM